MPLKLQFKNCMQFLALLYKKDCQFGENPESTTNDTQLKSSREGGANRQEFRKPCRDYKPRGEEAPKVRTAFFCVQTDKHLELRQDLCLRAVHPESVAEVGKTAETTGRSRMSWSSIPQATMPEDDKRLSENSGQDPGNT